MSGERLAVALRTLGCKVNRVESEDIAADLLGRGVRIVGEDEAAVVVVNTCTVTGEADAKARKAVRQALNAERSPIVVVTGCMATLSGPALEKLSDRVVVESDKHLVPSRVAEALGLGAEGSGAEPQDAGVSELHPAQPVSADTSGPVSGGPAFRTRAMLKIEDGCDAFCSYCIVPYARGVPRPVPFEAIVARAEQLVSRGAREIVLTGVNLGRYRDDSRFLADVVRRVASAGISRLRLSSIEPLDLTDGLLGVLASTPAACQHLHVPLQSASDRVLGLMNRRYSAADFERATSRAREAMPGLALTTDVIAGFPGEADCDASETLAFCREMGFAKIHVFRYSERAGTAAAEMPEVVPPSVRAARAASLRELDAELQAAFALAHKGAEVEVLVERVESSPGGRSVGLGTARDYLKVAIESGDRLEVGELVTATVVDVSSAPVRARVNPA